MERAACNAKCPHLALSRLNVRQCVCWLSWGLNKADKLKVFEIVKRSMYKYTNKQAANKLHT